VIEVEVFRKPDRSLVAFVSIDVSEPIPSVISCITHAGQRVDRYQPPYRAMEDVPVLEVAMQQRHIPFPRGQELSSKATRSFQTRREHMCLISGASSRLGSCRSDPTLDDVRQSREQPGRLFGDTYVMQAAHESPEVPDLIWACAGKRLAWSDAFE